jgi:parallel beta-helix repeat protein
MVIKNCVLQNCNIFVNYGQEIIITGNVIRNCWTNDTVAHFERGVGITIYGGGSSIIFGNTIADNQNGICITGTPSTLVYHNNFVNNTVDVTNYNVPFHSLGNATAQFDNGKEGNYWSRYAGEDANIDGIGDTPFYIGEGIQDNYPLMTSISPIVYVPSEATAIPTPTSNSSPAPLPSIPEYPAWASLPLLMLTLFIVIATKVRIQCSRPRGLRCDYLGAQETHIRAIAAALILSLRQLSYKWLSLIKLLAPTVCP